jgi:hypothetical protein
VSRRGVFVSSRFEQHYLPRAPSPTDPSGCARLHAQRTWGAMLGPVWSCAPTDSGAGGSVGGGAGGDAEGGAGLRGEAESTFALQLRAFVSAVRLHELRTDGASPLTFMGDALSWGRRGERAAERRAVEAEAAVWALGATSAESAVRNMELIDQIYEAGGLGARFSSAED